MYQQNLPSQGMNNYYQSGYPQQAYRPNTQAEMPYQQQIPQGNFLKGRPVVSIEEARAAQIDLDGSMFIFTDIGNKKIYTKQINLDGTATLNVYSLEENSPAMQSPEYVTKAELAQALSQLEAMIQNNQAQQVEDKKSAPLTF